MVAVDHENPIAKARTPNASHAPKYPLPPSVAQAPGRRSPEDTATLRYNSSIGQLLGSIMAIIMACHINRNIQAVEVSDQPGITIHIMDMVQPPGIRIPPC